MILVGPLTANTPSHWGLIPVLEARMREFIPRYHSDQDGDTLARFIRVHFVSDSGQMGAWLWVNDEMVPVGHLLAWVDQKVSGPKSAFVGQVESTERLSPAFRTQLIDAISAWAKSQGCTCIEGWVINPAILRLYRRLGIGRPVMTALRHELAGPPTLRVVETR